MILTHGHEDHIGAVPYFLQEIDVPVYGTAFTLALVERRLEEYDLEVEPRLIQIKPKQIVEIGPFKIEFIHVTHSIVSAVALAITTPMGVIIHTGDFKVDPTPTDNELFDLHTLADYGKRGVLLLMSDSTNADRPGYTESERAVRPRMEEVFNRAERRVVVSCFSSSIHRIQLVLDLAQEYGRRVAVIGRSMVSVTEIAHSLGLLDIPGRNSAAPAGRHGPGARKGGDSDFGHAGRADVGALARGGGQSQAHFGGEGRYGGAELAHHSGQ